VENAALNDNNCYIPPLTPTLSHKGRGRIGLTAG
jgi:hypothetical protein